MLDTTQKLVLALDDCLQSLNCAQQATLEIADQNYGQALRLIEQLQTQLLPRIETFPFSTKLQQWIPTQLDTIRSAALDDLKGWLGTVRMQTPILGELAFSRAQKRIEKWREIYEGVSTPTAINASAAQDSRSAAAYTDLVEMEREDAASIINNQQVQVDFSPLLQAVHLFGLMNRRSEFQSTFAEYRRAQAKVIFDLPVNLREGEGKSFANFLHQVCGFFIIEYFIVRKPQKFYSSAHVEGLWETVVRMINNYVLESLGDGSDQGLFMKIKWLQVFFLHAIEVYDLYSIASMLDTILSLFYRYVDLAKSERLQAIQASAQSANLRPLTVSSANAFARLQRQYSFLSEIDGEAGILPFSQFVLDVHSNISEFINNFYVFLEGVPQQSSELDDIAKKTADWLLEQSAKAYSERLEGAEITGMIQIIRDLECLQKTSVDIARLLTQKRQRTRSNPVVMSAGESLAKTSHEAEDHLFELINGELDGQFASNKYDFCPVVTPLTPSNLFQAFARYFQRTLETLGEAKIADQTLKQLKFNLFSHLATYLHETLYDKNVTSTNMNFLHQLDFDLKAIESLAQNEDPLIMEAFAETRQLITLMLTEQVHEFLDPIIRNRKYPNLRSGRHCARIAKGQRANVQAT